MWLRTDGRRTTYSGDIMLATDAATMHVDIKHSFLVYPTVVVPAHDKPKRYEGLNVEICVPTTSAILFDHGAETLGAPSVLDAHPP